MKPFVGLAVGLVLLAVLTVLWKQYSKSPTAGPAKLRSVPILQSWSGISHKSYFRSNSAAKRGFVTDEAGFRTLWAALRAGDPAPALNFAEVIVLVHAIHDTNQISTRVALNSSGDLKVGWMQTLVGMPQDEPDCSYRLDVVRRKGVRSVNGVEIEQ